MLKFFPQLLAKLLLVSISYPAVAQDKAVWLSNLKSEVLRLGIKERSYIHSIGRMQDSIMQSEDVFFISTLNLSELDIRFFPSGQVEIFKQYQKPDLEDTSSVKKNLSRVSGETCSTFDRKPPRVSLMVTNPYKRTGEALTSLERNLSRYITLLVKQVFSNASSVRWSPDTGAGSRYDGLLRGDAWSRSRYSISVIVNYETTSRGKISLTSFTNPREGFREPGKKFHFSISVELSDNGKPIQVLKQSVFLTPIAPAANYSNTEIYNQDSRASLEKVFLDLRAFLDNLNCHLEHSNSVVFKDGKLTLAAGIDAGYYEGDELLLLPKASYFKKRGLLSAVDLLAIARIIKIDKNRAELEIREGDVQLENGVEFSVKPLMDLI
ncbi:MAG: hypothetical protein VX513_01830 [Pseudomonadota bacterium]|nr:hypothetical protein [Pseudomonadota bacterium]